MTTLLATKLHQPAPPAKRVQRQHLRQRLTEGLTSDRQITLVSAPAGFGKTTCISEWVDTLDLPITWLSLDPADDDPGRFFAYFAAALQKVDKNLAQEVEGVMCSGRHPSSEVISTILSNEIVELETPFLLILDDIQVIQDHFILQVLQKLIVDPPPPLFLVLLTREDPPLPLARLRANNRLTEIRARDLRFAKGDAGHFLNDVMGLSLSQADIAVLVDKTEGWIVGLQLAALSIRDRPDSSGFIATLSSSHRPILNYLTEEVISQQPEEIQRFLRQTSILDKLNGDLCNAVTRRSDCRFLLERLVDANLFLIPLDDEQQWYRYHHLFADILRDLKNTRQIDNSAELHQRASHWYVQAGMVSEAIQHALAANNYEMVVRLLESHAGQMIMQGYVKTVHGYVQAMPDEWQLYSPKTNLAFAWMHLLRGTYAQATPYLDRLEISFADFQEELEEQDSLKAEWLAMRALLLNMQGKAMESLNLIAKILAIVPDQDSRVCSLAYYAQAGAYQVLNRYAEAVKAYQMAIQHGRVAENFVAEMMSVAGLANLALEHGQLHLAFEIASPVSARVERTDSPPPISAVVHSVLGQVYYQWNQVEEARVHILHAIQLSALGGFSTGTTFYKVLLSRLLQIEGDLKAADLECRQALDLMQLDAPTYIQYYVISQRVSVYLARNLLAAAEMVLQGQGFSFQDTFSFPELSSNKNITYPVGLLYNSSLRVLLYQAQARHKPTSLKPGIELANDLIAVAHQCQNLPVTLDSLLLRAQMYASLGNTQASREDYANALRLAEPEGFVTVFIEQGSSIVEALADLVREDQLGDVQPGYVKRVLDAFPKPQLPALTLENQVSPNLRAEVPHIALIEPLTERELEVLRLMAEGLKYKEIGERLFISLNTVRFYVKAIYSKLNVNNRTKAIEIAHQFKLL